MSKEKDRDKEQTKILEALDSGQLKGLPTNTQELEESLSGDGHPENRNLEHNITKDKNNEN